MASGGQETRWLSMDHLTVWTPTVTGICPDVDFVQGTEIDDAEEETSLGWTKSSKSNHAIVSDLRRAYNHLNILGSNDANRNVKLVQDKDFKTDGTMRVSHPSLQHLR